MRTWQDRTTWITLSMLTLLAALTGLTGRAEAAQYNCTWNTGAGTWETAGNWSNCNGTYPNNGADTFTATIDNASAAVTTGATAVTIDSLTVGGTNTSSLTLSFTLTVTGDVTINSNGTLTPAASMLVGGSWSNSGTFTHNSGAVTFNATTTGKTLSGTLNGSSAFYKVLFNGAGGGWTIQDAMLVSAANATDTLYIRHGTVTLGNGANDNLEVRGKFLVGTSTTGGDVAVFQTAALAQGSTITIDLNQNTSTPTCANCIIQVGAASGSTGSFKLAKNTILRLNPRSAATASDTGIEVESTGYLEILGERWPAAGDYADTGTDASPIDKRETKLCADTAFTAAEHTGKMVRMMTGLAVGKLYDISATTADDVDCATNTHDSVTITDTSVPSGTGFATMTVSGAGTTRTICADVNTLITANQGEVGRYLHDVSGTTGYFRIVYSRDNDAACSNNDSFTVVASPDAFAGLAATDDFKIVDGVRSGDAFEVLDYAHVTAENGIGCSAAINEAGEAYVLAKAGSESLIRYAELCNLGRNATDKYGATFKPNGAIE